MLRGRDEEDGHARTANPASPVAERLRLGDEYLDKEDGTVHRYTVSRPGTGLAISGVAGAVSGLLGVGGGFIKVPTMHVVMGVPMKPAVATSNFMIGVTAAASAFIYYSRGVLDPSLAGIVVIGVFVGTRIGTRWMVRATAGRVRFLFALLLAGMGVLMVLRAFVPGVGF